MMTPDKPGAMEMAVSISSATSTLSELAAPVAPSTSRLLNGTFGKLLSKWSIFYAPSEGIQVTVGGQLALLMLIEMLELCGISVVSANTDGLVIKCRRDMEWIRDQIVKWWEQTTGFETEAVNYRALMSKDVNNYIAIYQ